MISGGKPKASAAAAAAVIVRVVHPGDLFGFARALQRSDYPGTATTAAESVILSWQTDLWPHFVEQNPHLAVSAMQTIGQRLEEAHTDVYKRQGLAVDKFAFHPVAGSAIEGVESNPFR